MVGITDAGRALLVACIVGSSVRGLVPASAASAAAAAPGFLLCTPRPTGQGRGIGPVDVCRRGTPVARALRRVDGALSLRADAYMERFRGVGRLYGDDGLARLRQAHVCVVGLGGVGSWAAEALARSGIGALTLVDLDEVCLTNTNRQLCALNETVGMPKAAVLAARIQRINPECAVTEVQQSVAKDSARELLTQGSISGPSNVWAASPDLVDTSTGQGMPRGEGSAGGDTSRSVFDFVVDGIDDMNDKAALLAACVDLGVPVVASGGAGGLADPTAVRIADIADCEYDRLLKQVRCRVHSGPCLLSCVSWLPAPGAALTLVRSSVSPFGCSS